MDLSTYGSVDLSTTAAVIHLRLYAIPQMQERRKKMGAKTETREAAGKRRLSIRL